ncbi:MAG TPA: metalloregulator ArsR/SmtB family transcription factor [Polyangiaceae bacterium]|nr:metalloregulator ArsR/SmtB family transcription factor [Polyangiaceae bacterium]
MSAAAQQLERTFHALADVSRLGMVERLSRGPASVMELAEPLDMALPSVMKHLRVLEAGRLVRSKKNGRVRVYTLEPRAFTAVERWLGQRRQAWNDRFDLLDRLLAEES